MFNLLAGPIVRRVTVNRVCIWLAAKHNRKLKLTIFDGEGNLLGASDPDAVRDYTSQLGEKLCVYLLQARPTDKLKGFPLDRLLYYRIASEAGGEWRQLDLKALGLTYREHQDPSFFIPAKVKRLLYGSCRKPHGLETSSASLDSLSLGDREIEDHYEQLESRPALLILGGDQIYADDVAVSVLEMLRPRSLELLGYAEQIPGLSPSPSQMPPNARQALMQQIGFSSSAADNHLCGFGEFAAMYLWVFGNAEGWARDGALEESEARARALQGFETTLPAVRRLFANLATYMIFDDHDVTDDWNITGAWYERVRANPGGRRVVANALAAYWAFQAWGNDPENFDNDLRWGIEAFLTDQQTFTGDLAERFDLQLWAHRCWGFSVPSNPPIIALDSRTQRQADSDYQPARLLDRYALDWLCVEWFKLQTRPQTFTECPIFIAATPVVGFAPVEWLSRIGILLADALEDYKWVKLAEHALDKQGWLEQKIIEAIDCEAWSSSKPGLADFLNTLAGRLALSQVIFLSGDVHYGFTASGSYVHQTINPQTPLLCHQFTSSALCNTPSEKNRKALDGMLQLENTHNGQSQLADATLSWLPWNDWTLKTQLKGAAAGQSTVTEDSNLGLLVLDQNGLPAQHILLTGTGKRIEYAASATDSALK